MLPAADPAPSTWDEGWRSEAACGSSSADPRWWFPNDEFPRTPGAPPLPDDERETRNRLRREYEYRAVAICMDCPVRLDCTIYAITYSLWRGIWGGLNVRRRAHLARQWRTLGNTPQGEGSLRRMAPVYFAQADGDFLDRMAAVAAHVDSSTG
jgi:hypothetical protein